MNWLDGAKSPEERRRDAENEEQNKQRSLDQKLREWADARRRLGSLYGSEVRQLLGDMAVRTWGKKAFGTIANFKFLCGDTWWRVTGPEGHCWEARIESLPAGPIFVVYEGDETHVGCGSNMMRIAEMPSVDSASIRSALRIAFERGPGHPGQRSFGPYSGSEGG